MIQNAEPTVQTMPGIRKAAILLISLGEQTSAGVLVRGSYVNRGSLFADFIGCMA